MRLSLVTALAKHLNMEESDAARAVEELVADVRQHLEAGATVHLPELGTFRRQNGTVGFVATESLQRAAGLELEGAHVVTFPGKPGARAPEPPEELLQVTGPTEPAAVEVPQADEAEPIAEEPEPAADELEPAGAELESERWGDGSQSELSKEDAADEPPGDREPEVAAGAESNFAFDSQPAERPEDREPGEEEATSFEEEDESWDDLSEIADLEEEADEEDLEINEDEEETVIWRVPDETTHVLGGGDVPFEEGAFSFVDDDGSEADAEGEPPAAHLDDDDTLPVAAAGAAAAAAPRETADHRPLLHQDRPPEQHAKPRDVAEPRRARRKGTLVPILLVGAVLLLALAAAAYFMLRPDVDQPLVAGRDGPAGVASVPESGDTTAPEPVSDLQALESSGAGDGSVDSPVTRDDEMTQTAPSPPTSTPDATSPTTNPPFDVAAGGWTVVVGSATTAEEAEQIARRFLDQGVAPVVLYGPYQGVTRYRVAVNQFRSENEAIAFLRSAPSALPGDAWRMPVSTDLERIELED